jgi:hypothetical protein
LLRRYDSLLLYLFLGFLGSFLAFYLLRGFSIVTALPGGLILALMILAIITGLAWGIKKTMRF